MKQTITRTIVTTTINFGEIEILNGEPKFTTQEPIKIAGKVDSKQAVKEIEKRYAEDKQFALISIDTDSKVYEMDLEQFMENAKVITKNETEMN